MKTNPIIDEFMAQYVREYDFFSQLAGIAEARLGADLKRHGIRAIVSSRAKDPDRLRDKLIERSTRDVDRKEYHSVGDVRNDIVDLAGARIALYFPGDLDKVTKLISETFDVTKQIDFPNKDSEPHAKNLAGYLARHFRGHLKAGVGLQRRYATAVLEIQVASVLMHAWSEVDHDLRYKTLQGQPSVDEIAILDELNGLVLTGEIALERLQRSIESRVGEPGAHFANAYELQSFLSSSLPVANSAEVGRVDVLFDFLRNAEMDTPKALEPYLKGVVSPSAQNSAADQLIDRITAELPETYQLILTIMRKERERHIHSGVDIFPPSTESALGRFLKEWIKIEKKLRDITKTDPFRFESPLLRRPLEKYGLDANTAGEIIEIRDLRNEIVHGRFVPSQDVLIEKADRMAEILERLNRKG